jgi:DNA-directed RNA polymerase subunit RPC12/RpoP
MVIVMIADRNSLCPVPCALCPVPCALLRFSIMPELSLLCPQCKQEIGKVSGPTQSWEKLEDVVCPHCHAILRKDVAIEQLRKSFAERVKGAIQSLLHP